MKKISAWSPIVTRAAALDDANGMARADAIQRIRLDLVRFLFLLMFKFVVSGVGVESTGLRGLDGGRCEIEEVIV